jgi:uncharacterized protein
MKFTLDDDTTVHAVTARSAGEVRIGGRAYGRSLLVNATTIVEDWPVTGVEDLAAAIGPALELAPDVLILGTGERQLFPDPAVFAEVAARGVGFEVMDNGAACRTYNLLLAEGRNVALALIL